MGLTLLKDYLYEIKSFNEWRLILIVCLCRSWTWWKSLFLGLSVIIPCLRMEPNCAKTHQQGWKAQICWTECDLASQIPRSQGNMLLVLLALVLAVLRLCPGFSSASVLPVLCFHFTAYIKRQDSDFPQLKIHVLPETCLLLDCTVFKGNSEKVSSC